MGYTLWMRILKVCLVLLVGMLVGARSWGQSVGDAGQGGSVDRALRAVMEKSAADWNRGDLDAFATSYLNSPDIVFVGKQVSHGYAQMLARYRKNYPTAEARGTLTYSNLEVHPLDARFATVIGNCHLERTAAGGGNFNCVFSLVFKKTAAGWKIVLDHSSAV